MSARARDDQDEINFLVELKALEHDIDEYRSSAEGIRAPIRVARKLKVLHRNLRRKIALLESGTAQGSIPTHAVPSFETVLTKALEKEARHLCAHPSDSESSMLSSAESDSEASATRSITFGSVVIDGETRRKRTEVSRGQGTDEQGLQSRYNHYNVISASSSDDSSAPVAAPPILAPTFTASSALSAPAFSASTFRASLTPAAASAVLGPTSTLSAPPTSATLMMTPSASASTRCASTRTATPTSNSATAAPSSASLGRLRIKRMRETFGEEDDDDEHMLQPMQSDRKRQSLPFKLASAEKRAKLAKALHEREVLEVRLEESQKVIKAQRETISVQREKEVLIDSVARLETHKQVIGDVLSEAFLTRLKSTLKRVDVPSDATPTPPPPPPYTVPRAHSSPGVFRPWHAACDAPTESKAPEFSSSSFSVPTSLQNQPSGARTLTGPRRRTIRDHSRRMLGATDIAYRTHRSDPSVEHTAFGSDLTSISPPGGAMVDDANSGQLSCDSSLSASAATNPDSSEFRTSLALGPFAACIPMATAHNFTGGSGTAAASQLPASTAVARHGPARSDSQLQSAFQGVRTTTSSFVQEVTSSVHDLSKRAREAMQRKLE